jgi:hypothetical protein
METLTRRLGDLSARRPWPTIGAWAVLTALIVALAGSVGGTLVDEFSAPGTDSANAQDLLEKNFPQAAGGSIFGKAVLTTDLSTVAGWAVNIAVAECLIRRPARRRRVPRASRASVEPQFLARHGGS